MKLLTRTAIAAGFASAALVAQAATFATFADPTIGQSNPLPLFTLDTVGNTLSGSYTGGITLVTSATTYNGVSLSMKSVAATPVVPGVYNLSAGAVTLSNASDSNILTISFAAGTLSDNGFGGSDFKGNGVTFSGSSVPSTGLTNEAFGFSFANPAQAGNNVTYTAAFTSSASPVPEPASLAVLGIGAIAMIRRRKRA